MPIRNKHIRSGETTIANRKSWRDGFCRRAAAAALSASLVAGAGGCSNSYSEAESSGGALPSTSQGDTYIPPDPKESIPLNLDGIFTEGTVGEEVLPVVASDSGMCTDEGLAREESAPMYWVDGAAVQSLISAIELATIELKEAREEEGLLVGSTPDGRQVMIQFGDYLPNLPYRQVRDGAKVRSQEITTISINIKNPQGFVTNILYIIMSGIGSDCTSHNSWAGWAFSGDANDESSWEKFNLVAKAANGAINFEVLEDSSPSPQIDPADPTIPFPYQS